MSLASVNDINAFLDGQAVSADGSNTKLIQISVERWVKAYLGRVVSQPTLDSWADPESTPNTVREIAGRLVAAQFYRNEISKATTEVDKNNYAQLLYDQAMAMMNQVITGDVSLPEVDFVPVESLSVADFFPIDSTDRAFTLGKKFYGSGA